MSTSPLSRWQDLLAGWAIPAEIEAAAPRSPWALSVGSFRDRVEEVRREPSAGHLLARERIPAGGSVLDVGCGAGAASAPLLPPATVATGVDENPDMLRAFAETVRAAGHRPTAVRGRWPDVADEVGPHDVALAFHVAYNVPDLDAFVVALTAAARRRVVLVLPDRHPMSWTAPYWRRLHGLDRPSGPTVDDAVAVVRTCGIDVQHTSWIEPWSSGTRDEAVDRVLQRLCLGPERADEVAHVLDEIPLPTTRAVSALWWDPAAGR